MDEFRYERGEITRVLMNTPPGEMLRLKVAGKRGESRWLPVTQTQVRAVRAVLAGGDLGEVRAALAGRLDPPGPLSSGGAADADHRARPDDDPEPGDRCKDCGGDITWLGPGSADWEHADY